MTAEHLVTDGDREKAMRVLGWDPSWGPMELVSGNRVDIEAVAVALAEEREKARAPFLALADEYERHAGLMQAEVDSGGPLNVVMRSQSFLDAAASIRTVAEVTE